MGTREKDLIREKLTRLAEYIEEAAPYLKQTYQRHAKRKGDQRIVERLAQIIVETASDINDLLIANAGGAPAPHARASFERLHEIGLLPAPLAERFADRYVRMRNLLVHQYDRLDTRTVFYTSRRLLEDAKEYVATLEQRLAADKD